MQWREMLPPRPFCNSPCRRAGHDLLPLRGSGAPAPCPPWRARPSSGGEWAFSVRRGEQGRRAAGRCRGGGAACLAAMRGPSGSAGDAWSPPRPPGGPVSACAQSYHAQLGFAPVLYSHCAQLNSSVTPAGAPPAFALGRASAITRRRVPRARARPPARPLGWRAASHQRAAEIESASSAPQLPL